MIEITDYFPHGGSGAEPAVKRIARLAPTDCTFLSTSTTAGGRPQDVGSPVLHAALQHGGMSLAYSASIRGSFENVEARYFLHMLPLPLYHTYSHHGFLSQFQLLSYPTLPPLPNPASDP